MSRSTPAVKTSGVTPVTAAVAAEERVSFTGPAASVVPGPTQALPSDQLDQFGGGAGALGARNACLSTFRSSAVTKSS